MLVDSHVHVFADTPGHGRLSPRVRNGLLARLVRWRLGITARAGLELERQAAAKLVETVAGATRLDRAVVLAFDAVHDDQGRLDLDRTHLYVTNDYAADLAERHPKLLFGASVHPYRANAIAELEHCIARGAVLLKWLPIVQDMNPSDSRCFPIYDVLAHHRLPLLCHTGGERSLPNLNCAWADPDLLVPALERGVTVIMAHCGTRDRRSSPDFVPSFVRLARRYENCYGDTAALNLPTRSYAYAALLQNEIVRNKLVHGSDWPIIPVPPRRIGWLNAARLLIGERNWLSRDIRIKERLGFDEAYWHRAAGLLRLPAACSV